jgi:hypothetical protein
VKIIKKCAITVSSITLDGKIIHTNKNNSELSVFVKEVFKKTGVDYPKFYKMDDLSRLCLLTSELLLKDYGLSAKYNPGEVGVVIANSVSCLPTDLLFQETIADPASYFPSPLIFPYTLPNTMIAELCIRNNIKGETAFFVFEKPDLGFISEYVDSLFSFSSTKCCVVGWVEPGTSYLSIIKKGK